jgi:hypothetical protein
MDMKTPIMGRLSSSATSADAPPRIAVLQVSIRCVRSWSVPYAAVFMSENPNAAVSSV